MGNHQLQAGSRALLGGVLAGVAPSLGGPLLMVPALALLWSVVERPRWSAGWGLLAVLVSHRWLLALHPLTWMGVPAWLSLPVALGLWLACGSLAALLLAGWSVLARWLPRRWPRPVRVMLLAGLGPLVRLRWADIAAVVLGLLPSDAVRATRCLASLGLARIGQCASGPWLGELAVVGAPAAGRLRCSGGLATRRSHTRKIRSGASTGAARSSGRCDASAGDQQTSCCGGSGRSAAGAFSAAGRCSSHPPDQWRFSLGAGSATGRRPVLLFPWLINTVWCRLGNGSRPFPPGLRRDCLRWVDCPPVRLQERWRWLNPLRP